MALINIRVDDSLKENVETILEDMGLNMTTAITIYLKEIVRSKQIPFTIVSNIKNIEENVSSKEEPVDETYNKIKEFAKQQKYMTMSSISRNFAMGFVKASEYFDKLKDDGVIKEDPNNHRYKVIK
ncbi:MAG: type II toxin-antitoxin system RelB/DinJ family antitoxin [Candidatus Onthovivens sp.]|nr:type II toxin-antitoxin system RelB/DinJ family antitoxin [Bacilli bacterium]